MMKNRGSNLTILFLLCLGGFLAVPSKLLAVPRLSLIAAPGFGKATVEVPLTLRYRTNDIRNIVGLQADVHFDHALATGSEPIRGSFISEQVFGTHTLRPGWQRVLVFAENYTVFTNGEIARFSFSVGSGVLQNIHLTLSNVFLTTAEGESVPVNLNSGAIVINPVFLKSTGGADGYLTVNTNSESDQCFVVQATTDFNQWTNIDTNTQNGRILLFTDIEANSYNHRFYRAVLCESSNAIKLSNIAKLLNGRLSFDFSSAIGTSYLIQASTNLRDWVDLSLLPGDDGILSFIDLSVTNHKQRFYRVVSQ